MQYVDFGVEGRHCVFTVILSFSKVANYSLALFTRDENHFLFQGLSVERTLSQTPALAGKASDISYVQVTDVCVKSPKTWAYLKGT